MNVYVDTIPWYKQPLVWMVIAIPFSAVVVCVVLLYFAITTDDGLVADDYYKQGMTINRQLERDELASVYKISSELVIEISTGFVKAEFNKGNIKKYPSQLNLILRYAAKQENDRQVVLYHGLNNIYSGSVAGGVNAGIWHLELSNLDEVANDQWRLVRRVRLEDVSTVKIQAK